jgi:hypothetical protein
VNKKLYSAFSFFDFISCLIVRIAAVFTIGFCVYKYEENPFVFILIIITAFWIVFYMGEEEIVIYPNKVVQRNNSILSLVLKSYDKAIEIKKVKKAYIDELSSAALSDIGIAGLLHLLMPKRSRGASKKCTIYLELANGEVDRIETTLSGKRIKEIVHNINVLVKK